MICGIDARCGLSAGIGLAAGIVIGAGAIAAASDGPAQPEMEEMDADAMMEAMAEANQLSDYHAQFADMVGTWDGHLTAEMPGGQAYETHGVMTNELIMGGRFLKQTWRGEMMGQPFTGQSFIGHNTITDTHQSVWFDSTANTIHFYEGDTTEDGTIVMMGEETDPMSGVTLETKDTITHTDADHMSFVRTYLTPDGEAPGFAIEYTRRK